MFACATFVPSHEADEAAVLSSDWIDLLPTCEEVMVHKTDRVVRVPTQYRHSLVLGDGITRPDRQELWFERPFPCHYANR
jgi:hypothetical protein